MYSALDKQPAWHRGARQRLLASIAIAAIVAAALLLFVDFDDDPGPVDELDVFLTYPESTVIPEPEPEPVIEEPVPDIGEPVVEEKPLPEEVPVEVPMEAPDEPEVTPRDWYAEMDKAVEAVVKERQRTWSVNPAFDEKRRQAALKFRPSRAPVKKPVWENVETDQLGRKILVSGDCHRVVDDPSAVNYEIFRTFTQYVVFCSKYQRQPKDLPWVDDVRERYAYLRDPEPDNSVRSDLMADLN